MRKKENTDDREENNQYISIGKRLKLYLKTLNKKITNNKSWHDVMISIELNK